jgi:hypothetical protein
VSDAHAEADGHTAVGHVALIVGPGDPASFRRELLHGAAHIGAGRTWTGRMLLLRRSSVAGEVE